MARYCSIRHSPLSAVLLMLIVTCSLHRTLASDTPTLHHHLEANQFSFIDTTTPSLSSISSSLLSLNSSRYTAHLSSLPHSVERFFSIPFIGSPSTLPTAEKRQLSKQSPPWPAAAILKPLLSRLFSAVALHRNLRPSGAPAWIVDDNTPDLSLDADDAFVPFVARQIDPSPRSTMTGTATATPSLSNSPSLSVDSSATPSVSQSVETSSTASTSASASFSTSSTTSPTMSLTPSSTPSISTTTTPTATVGTSASASGSVSPTVTPSVSTTPSATVGTTATTTATVGTSASPSSSESTSFSPTVSSTASTFSSPSVSATAFISFGSLSGSETPSPSASSSAKPSIVLPSPSMSPSIVPEGTVSPPTLPPCQCRRLFVGRYGNRAAGQVFGQRGTLFRVFFYIRVVSDSQILTRFFVQSPRRFLRVAYKLDYAETDAPKGLLIGNKFKYREKKRDVVYRNFYFLQWFCFPARYPITLKARVRIAAPGTAFGNQDGRSKQKRGETVIFRSRVMCRRVGRVANFFGLN